MLRLARRFHQRALAIEAVSGCMCSISIMWLSMPSCIFIMPARIVRRSVTISVTRSAVAATFSMPDALLNSTTRSSSR